MAAAFILASCSEQPEPQTLSLDKTQITFSASAADQLVQVTANCNWSVAVTEGSDWLSVTPLQGQGSSNITLTAKANTGPDRTAAVKIYSAEKEVRISVVQKEQEILYRTVSSYVPCTRV